MTRARILSLFALWVALGCGGGGATVQPVDGERVALVVTTDYQTGSYAVVDLETRTAVQNINVIHQDAVCRVDGERGTPYVIARLGADAVDVLSPQDNWTIGAEYSVGAGTSPQDIAVVSDEKAYVALYSQPHLLVVHPRCGEPLGTVDLSMYADADGIPEVGWLAARGGKVYALLQRLSRNDGFAPTDESQLLVIDAESDQVEAVVTLAATNPAGKLRFNPVLERFVIIESGTFTTMVEGASPDGAIEYFNPEDNTLSGPVVSAGELGGDIVDAVIVSASRGYAIVGVSHREGAATHLVRFDPATGERRATLLASDSWDFTFIELSPDHKELWLADRSVDAPGVRIFDAETDGELTVAPIDVGLPPFMICFADVPVAEPGEDTESEPEDTATMDTDSQDTESGEPDTGVFFGVVADTVVDAPCADTEQPFGDPSLAVNGVRGTAGGGMDVFSMRYYSDPSEQYITLGWSGQRVVNGEGTDFAVFENGYRIGGGPATFMEQLVVYLSEDGVEWVPFPFDYIYSPESDYSQDPSDWVGFAGVNPVLYHEEENPVDPFDPAVAGGDHFDLDDLPDTGEGASIKANGFVYLKLVQATTVINPDTGDFFLKDSASFDNAAELDGVIARYTEPL